eukprot:scaffold4871_cov116-Skeletonema_marinoi.AAC.2
MSTPPGNVAENNKDPFVPYCQTLVDNGITVPVPVVYRTIQISKLVDRKYVQERKIKVLACLHKDGDVTLGSNHNPNETCVDVVLEHVKDENGRACGISHHACTIKRIDYQDNSEVSFVIEGSPTQEKSDSMRIDKGTKLILVQHTWGEGKLNIENIGRVYSGKNVSVIAKQHTSPCIQVTHDGEILDQIFISIPPDWNLMTQDYRVDTERLYYIPPGEVSDSPPKVADSCGVPQQTQESVKSLAPGVPLKLSQLSAKEEKVEKKIVDSIFRNGMDDDPVQMIFQTSTAVDGTQEPKQGASLDIYKTIALPSAVAHTDPDNSEPEYRGTIFDCAAVYTGLTATQQYKHPFGYVYRQEYTPSSSCNPLNDLQDRIKSKKGVDFRDRSAYFLGRSTLSMGDAHELALHLAPSYKEEFTALFESEEAFQAELHNVQNNVNFFSPIMVTVIARALLCPIILFLPDKDKPVYFYPYPMKDGEPSPQFGDYQRPAMRLTLWTDSQLSLLVPVGYDDKLVDCTPSRIVKKDSKNVKGKDVKGKDGKGKDGKGKDGKGEEDEGEEVEGKDGKGKDGKRKEVEGEDGKGEDGKRKQTRIHLFPLHLQKPRGKKKKHYVEDDKGKPVLRPVFNILTYNSLDDDRLVEAEALRSKMAEYLQEHYPRDDEKVYNISDIQQDLFENGFFKFRNKIVIRSRDPLNYLCVSKKLPPGHLAVDNPYLSGGQGRQKCVTYETVCAYRRESIDRVHELANNELKSEIDKCMLSGFLDSNMENHPTMTRALGHIDLFHSTPVSPSNGQLQVFDVHYIRAIDKANGPYKGDSNSGDQISGGDWFDELSEEVQVQVKAFHLKYCHLPAWMISISGHIAISKHMTLEDIHSKCVYAGTTGLGANYFSRYKGDRSSYVSLQRHTIWNIPCSLAREAQFRAVGDNTLGCDQLAKSYFPFPLTTV